MDRQSKIIHGLNRAAKADAARQQATERIASKAYDSDHKTVLGLDARLQVYGRPDLTPDAIAQLYTQPQQPPQQ